MGRLGLLVITCAAHAAQSPPAPLTLDVQVIGQTLCKADNEIGFAELTLRLRFTNAGKEVQFLHRGIGTIRQVQAATTMDRLHQRIYALDVSLTAMTAVSIDAGRSTWRERLAPVRSGQTLEVRGAARLPMLLAGDKGPGLRQGDYYARVWIDVWPEGERELNDARRETKGLGRVLHTGIWSAPFPLTVPKESAPSACK